jgi:hypothetical protein
VRVPREAHLVDALHAVRVAERHGVRRAGDEHRRVPADRERPHHRPLRDQLAHRARAGAAGRRRAGRRAASRRPEEIPSTAAAGTNSERHDERASATMRGVPAAGRDRG